MINIAVMSSCISDAKATFLVPKLEVQHSNPNGNSVSPIYKRNTFLFNVYVGDRAASVRRSMYSPTDAVRALM